MNEIKEKHKLLKKSWKIDLNRIDEGYMYSEMSVLAYTAQQARSKLLNKYRWDFQINNEDATYITIPVIRNHTGDLYEYDGKELTSSQIADRINSQKRKQAYDAILNDSNITHCHIIKRGSYYMPNYCGYTDQKNIAGVYTKEDAVSHCLSCDELSIRPIIREEHNEMINKAIEDLKTRLI